MKKSAAASRRTARAGTSGSPNKSSTTRKAKTAATAAPKTRAMTVARAGTRTKTPTTTKTQTTLRRGQPVRSREVGGSPWPELREQLLGSFENAFADRKGQARGAAMRGPNRIIAEIDKHIQAIARQTQSRQTQVTKLTNELTGLRSQTQQQGSGAGWPAGVSRTEHTATDPGRIAGQPTETERQPMPAASHEGEEEMAETTQRRGSRSRSHQPASLD